MRVIKDNTKECFYTKCKTCRSEIEYEYNDVTIEKIEFTAVPNRYLFCPVCGAKTPAELEIKANYNDASACMSFDPFYALGALTAPKM